MVLSYRLNALLPSTSSLPYAAPISLPKRAVMRFSTTIAGDHSAHPALGHLVLLVFEAVMEVVCVSLPGYIVARQGMFDADKQKFVANLNVALFTPCLSMSPSLVCVIFCLVCRDCVDIREVDRGQWELKE